MDGYGVTVFGGFEFVFDTVVGIFFGFSFVVVFEAVEFIVWIFLAEDEFEVWGVFGVSCWVFVIVLAEICVDSAWCNFVF